MSYLLRFDGSNDYCSFPNSISIDLGTSAYTLEIKCEINELRSPYSAIIGRNGTAAGFFVMPNGAVAAYSANSLRYQTAAGFFEVGVLATHRLEHDAGGAWRAYKNGSLFGSGTYASSTIAAPLIWLGQGNNSGNSYLSADVEYIELTGPANAQKWDANLSGGTGSALPTTSGTNNATLVNFPTDNSQWIFYGSGAITADIDFTMPQMAVAVTADSLVPIFSASVAVTMPQMAIDATANAIAPSSGATIAITMPQMSIAALAVSSVPVFASSIALAMPQMLVSVAADNITSSVAALVSITMPQMSVSGTASSTVPIISASVSVTMPQMVVRVLTGGISYYTTPSAHIEQVAQSTHLEYVAQSTHLEYTNRSTHIEWRA